MFGGHPKVSGSTLRGWGVSGGYGGHWGVLGGTQESGGGHPEIPGGTLGCRGDTPKVLRGVLEVGSATPRGSMWVRGCPVGRRGGLGGIFGAPPPYFEDLLGLLVAVGGGGDDEQAVEEIDGESVGALVVGSPNPKGGKDKVGGSGGSSAPQISPDPPPNVPYRVMPRLVAMMRTGAMSLSSARLRNEKHSMSNM